jgi:predicted phosphodiesterase
MKRREFLGTLTAGALGGSLSHAQTAIAPAESVPAASRLTRTPLVLMAPRLDGVEAVWAVNKLCKGRIEWEAEGGESGVAATDNFGFVPQGGKILRVRLAGLKPGTKYRVRSITVAADDAREETSPWKEFRPLNAQAAGTSFVVWNDTHVNNETIRKLHEVTPDADFLLWNGDTCNDWTSEELLIPTLLHPGECDISKGRPLFVTWGNHDVRGPHAFQMPELIATPNGRPFHAFRSGPVACVCLHTGEDKPDSHPSFRGRVAFDSLRREQAEWLASTIQHPEFRDAPYRIVFCHIPLRGLDESPQDYEKGGFDRHSGRSRAVWNEALVKWKVQLIVSGHTHRHTWLPATNEFPYGQMIGGGPSPRAATWMQGSADASRLQLVVRDLSGKVLHEVNVTPTT